jgi:mannitol/fructose-specific phosphotransferase system IIA component (Ntr-type)
MALLKLATPCESGSANDPVTLVFALCSPDSESHLDLLAAFAEKLSDSQVMNSLLNASAESVISAILFENQL